MDRKNVSATSPSSPTTQLTPLRVSAMLLLAVMWGLSIPVTKLGLQSVPPITLTALRFAVAVPLFWLCLIGRKRLPLAAVPRAALLGVIGIGVGQVSESLGIERTTASVSTIISATIPIFIVLFAALRLKQAVSGLHLLGLAAAFAGIVLVALDNSGGNKAQQTTFIGAGFVLLSTLAIAFYYVWSVELSAKYGTIPVAAVATLTGLLTMLPGVGWETFTVSFHVQPIALAAAAYLGVMVTIAGLLLWLWLLRTFPARMAASVQFLQPVFGIAASAAIFGDRMGVLFAFGVALILAGIGLSMTKRR
jgi:drug/metabolite transporter (DMT)-like permease